MSDITWSFAGKVALVSGGASGIGRAAAAAWIAAGARVGLFDQSAGRREGTAGALGRDALATGAGALSGAGACERARARTRRWRRSRSRRTGRRSTRARPGRWTPT